MDLAERLVSSQHAMARELLSEGRAELARLRVIRGSTPGKTAKRARRVRNLVALASALVLAQPPDRVRATFVPRFDPPSAFPFGIKRLAGSNPAFADLDADADLDVLIADINGPLLYLRNTGSAGSPAFESPSTTPFGLSTVGGRPAPAFADIDADGDLDLFVGEQDGTTNLFVNFGSASVPAFGGSASNPHGLIDVGSDSSPELVDIDGDTDLDAFVGRNNGDTLLFVNSGSAAAPAFGTPATNPSGLSSAGGYSAPDFADIDGDGDLDAMIGNSAGYTNFFRNTGTVGVAAFATPSTNPFGLADAGDFARPDLVDIDGDGDLDAMIGNSGGLTNFFENTGTASVPTFIAPTISPFGLAASGGPASPALVDIDGDGDLDAFIGGGSASIRFFRNTGSSSAASFTTHLDNPFGLTVSTYGSPHTEASPDFADLDGDGDLDALVGVEDGSMLFFANTSAGGDPAFAAPSSGAFGLADVGTNAEPDVGDIDADGDLDVLVGASDGNLRLFTNTVSAVAPAFSMSVNPLGLSDVGSSSAPTLSDIDDDGDLDAIVGTSAGNQILFRNTGSAVAPAFASPSTDPYGLIDVGVFSAPEFADIDDDGALDGFIGESGRDVAFFANLATPPDPLNAPTDIGLSASTVAENQAGGTAIGTLSAEDLDPDDVHTFTLVSGAGSTDNASFSISGDQLSTAAALDFEAGASRSIRVRVTDGDGNQFAKPLTITVTNVAEAPTAVLLTNASVAENEPSDTSIGSLSATDEDAGDSHTFTLVSGTGSTDNAAFTIVGSQLKTATGFDFEADASKSIRVRATDSTALTREQIFTITVTDAAEAPTDITLTSASVLENAAPGTVVGTLDAVDPDAGDLHIFSLVSGAGGDDNISFSIVDDQLRTAATFDFETDAVKSVRVRVADGEGFTFERALTIDVTDVEAQLVVSDFTKKEGDQGKRAFTFTITRSVDTSGPASVDVSTADGTAKAPKDYLAVPTTMIEFANGEVTKTVTVFVKGDTRREGKETFTVVLTDPAGAAIMDASGVGTIKNDD